jgi:DNA-binding Xre family transcriptional regulator
MQKTTFDREMENPAFKETFEREYEDFLLSETLCQAMEENQVSVRKLAEQAHVSAGFIQGIRSGKAKNITLGKLSPVLEALGFLAVVPVRPRERWGRIPLTALDRTNGSPIMVKDDVPTVSVPVHGVVGTVTDVSIVKVCGFSGTDRDLDTEIRAVCQKNQGIRAIRRRPPKLV